MTRNLKIRSSLFTVVATVMLGLLATGFVGAVTYDFNAGGDGFTSTLNTAAFDGPWVHGATAGVGGSGGWSTEGQSPENSHANTTDLTSPAFVMGVAGALTLSFDHRYSFEFDGTRWDGGAVMVALNGGAFAAVPGASFSANGYNGTVAANSLSQLAGQEAFTSVSAGYANGAFINSVANLGVFALGDSVQVRFRAAYDSNTTGGSPDWAIDNVSLSAVPEPCGFALLASALGVFAAARNRR